MQMSWISSSTNLPRDGESIQFLADGREVGMRGTYTSGVFHSRWAEYDVGRVGAWHALDTERMQTSRSMLDRLLNETDTSLTIETLSRASQALGYRIKVELEAA